MRKAVLAGAVAVAAVGGVVAAMLVSSGDGGGKGSAAPGSTDSTAAATTRDTTTSGSTPTVPGATTRQTTLPADFPPPPSTKDPKRTRAFVVGTVDDALAQVDPRVAQSEMDASRSAGFDAAAVSATWHRGETAPPASLVRVLRNVSRAAAKRDVELFVVVWHGLGEDTPRDAAERAQFAKFAAALVRTLGIRHVIVGNEPNLSTFWRPQFGAGGSDAAARGYGDLLARTYDAVKAADAHVQVLGGAVSPRGADRPGGVRPTHSPTTFIRDLGVAYRASGRTKPLMDAFAFHPYMQASRDSPAVAHPENTNITIADYPKLVALLEGAFPDGGRLPVYYTEFGVQTSVPRAKRRFYEDLEAAARTDVVPFPTQTAYYRRALELAYCQPTVRGLFVFHTFDEPSLNGWQSGLYFADGTPKPSLPGFQQAVRDLRTGRFPSCR